MYAPAVFTTTGPVDVGEAVAAEVVTKVDRLPGGVEVVEMLLIEVEVMLLDNVGEVLLVKIEEMLLVIVEEVLLVKVEEMLLFEIVALLTK